MSHGPLDDPRLQAVEAALDGGQLELAQRLLADLDQQPLHRQGMSYLTTRLLFQRGRLSIPEVALRMQQVLQSAQDFPQAQALLSAAAGGTLSPASLSSEPATQSYRPALAPDIPGPPALPSFEQGEPLPPNPSLAPSVELDTQPLLGAEFPNNGPPTIPDLSMALATGSDPDAVPEPLVQEAWDDPTTEPAAPPSSNFGDGEPEFEPDPTPTLFSVLTLLDEHRYVEALRVISESPNANTPQLTLMRARALIGEGRYEDACEALELVCQSTAIGPELRAGCARLLIEAAEPELALEQAEAARAIAPESPAVLLTSAWALLRMARREQDDEQRDKAAALLQKLDNGGGPTPALATALRACIAAETGSPEEALTQAHRALELDPSSVDALAALATAHAALGQSSEAGDAWRRLSARDRDEAHALRPALTRLGTRLERPSPSLMPSVSEPTSRRVWDPLESALVSGEREALLDAWNADCEHILAALDADPAQLGRLAATALTQAPGFCHFAPYDLSLWSLLRLGVAVDLVFGKDPMDHDRLEGRLGSLLVLSAYIGESVRLAYEGSWRGRLAQPDRAFVETGTLVFSPYQLVSSRLLTGEALELDQFAALEIAHRSQPQWSRRLDEHPQPPTPWAPEQWPSVEVVGSVGRALSRSVVGMYCEQFAQTALDHSVGGVSALDSYLTLIAPPGAPASEPSPVLIRTATIVGAYVGEVLRSRFEGHWLEDHERGSAAYIVEFGRMSTRPVQQVFARLCGTSQTTVTEYVTRLRAQLGH